MHALLQMMPQSYTFQRNETFGDKKLLQLLSWSWLSKPVYSFRKFSCSFPKLSIPKKNLSKTEYPSSSEPWVHIYPFQLWKVFYTNIVHLKQKWILISRNQKFLFLVAQDSTKMTCFMSRCTQQIPNVYRSYSLYHVYERAKLEINLKTSTGIVQPANCGIKRALHAR